MKAYLKYLSSLGDLTDEEIIVKNIEFQPYEQYELNINWDW